MRLYPTNPKNQPDRKILHGMFLSLMNVRAESDGVIKTQGQIIFSSFFKTERVSFDV
jgi:hypothetical protein